MKYHIYWEDQFSKWKRYGTMHSLPTAIQTAKRRTNNTGKRHKITDDSGGLVDIFS